MSGSKINLIPILALYMALSLFGTRTFAAARGVINLYNSNLAVFHPEDSEAQSYPFLSSKMDITVDEKEIREIFERTGSILIRPLIQTESPKLVIGCGNCELNPTDFHFHPSEDTIDPVLHNNPSIVSRFGKESQKILPSNHYHSILDEVILAEFATDGDISSLYYQTVYWDEIELTLKDGGFFFSVFRGDIERWESLPTEETIRLPSQSKMKVFGLMEYSLAVYSDRRNPVPYDFKMSALVVAKPHQDGSLPDELVDSDLPSGMKLIRFCAFFSAQ